MRRRRAALGAALLAGAGLVAAVPSTGADAGEAADRGLDEVMRSLAQRRHGEADFVEQHFLALLKHPVESSGELIYDAPDRLEKRTLAPRPESLILEGDVLTVAHGRRSRVLDLKSLPQVLPYVDCLRATLAGDRTALERTFRLQFSGDAAHWTLLLIPLDAAVAKTVRQVRIEGTGNSLLEVEIRQADGDRSLMSLHTPAGS
jgi:hypothetical protein